MQSRRLAELQRAADALPAASAAGRRHRPATGRAAMSSSHPSAATALHGSDQAPHADTWVNARIFHLHWHGMVFALNHQRTDPGATLRISLHYCVGTRTYSWLPHEAFPVSAVLSQQRPGDPAAAMQDLLKCRLLLSGLPRDALDHYYRRS